MQEFLDACFTGPVLPASILLVLVCVYWLLALAGALELDLFDFDLSIDTDGHSLTDIGFISLRFLNLGRVPVMIWVSAFALGFWIASMAIDSTQAYSGLGETTLAVLRNAGLGLVAAKLMTHPLRDRFELREPNPAQDLIGRKCVITTSEATADFGWARLDTGAAPLDLNVRAIHGTLLKGEAAEICDYDPEHRTYFVKRVDS